MKAPGHYFTLKNISMALTKAQRESVELILWSAALIAVYVCWTAAFVLKPQYTVCSPSVATDGYCAYSIDYGTQSCAYMTLGEWGVAAWMLLHVAWLGGCFNSFTSRHRHHWTSAVFVGLSCVCLLPPIMYYVNNSEQFFCSYSSIGGCNYVCTSFLFGVSRFLLVVYIGVSLAAVAQYGATMGAIKEEDDEKKLRAQASVASK